MHAVIAKSHEEWLIERQKGIGASDAGTILGVNPWKTNIELWEEKTGRRKAEDISDKPYVRYGNEAEEHIRALFALDHPELIVNYESPYKIIHNADHEFITCTPDGELVDRETGRIGGLEIKTTEIMNGGKWAEWDGRIPDQYYCQVLHQMIAADWGYVWLRALIKYTARNGEKRSEMRDYFIGREEVEEDIKMLICALQDFWGYVQRDECPPLRLPDI